MILALELHSQYVILTPPASEVQVLSPCRLAARTHAALASHQHQLTALRQVCAARVVASDSQRDAACYSLRKAAQLLHC
jgi:hypothetical protein